MSDSREVVIYQPPQNPGRGRPSKYRPEYCDLIVEAMTAGKSIASVAADIGVARSTIQEWEAVHPDFSVAVKVGKAKCAAWWEERLRNIAMLGGGAGAVTAAIFGLKNMASDDWREESKGQTNVNIDLRGVPDDQLERYVAAGRAIFGHLTQE
jgi:hypothetical protein